MAPEGPGWKGTALGAILQRRQTRQAKEAPVSVSDVIAALALLVALASLVVGALLQRRQVTLAAHQDSLQTQQLALAAHQDTLQAQQMQIGLQEQLDTLITKLIECHGTLAQGPGPDGMTRSAHLMVQVSHLALEADSLVGRGGVLSYAGYATLGSAFMLTWELEEAERYNRGALQMAHTAATGVHARRNLAQFLFTRARGSDLEEARQLLTQCLGRPDVAQQGADYAAQFDTETCMMWASYEMAVGNQPAAQQLVERAKAIASGIISPQHAYNAFSIINLAQQAGPPGQPPPGGLQQGGAAGGRQVPVIQNLPATPIPTQRGL